MKTLVATLFLATTTTIVSAQSTTPLKFDPAQLCAWQNTNNNMDVAECTKLETEAQTAIPPLETAADPARKDACTKEAQNFSGDSGFASYTVYAGCLKDGPGSL
jgi:hypothetical protein